MSLPLLHLPVAEEIVKTPIGLLRLQLAVTHLMMALAAFLRPHMIELVPAYDRFGEIGPTTGWGWACLIIGTGLLWLPRSSAILILWQTASAIIFSLFCLLVTARSGLTWGTMVYGCLALSSVVVAFTTSDGFFKKNGLPKRVRSMIEGEGRA